MKPERELIRKIREAAQAGAGSRRASGGSGKASAATQAAGFLRTGIGDDSAVLRPRAGEELLVTTDFSIEGTHFRRDWHPPESVGHRCLARGLSDIAAMGGRPLVYFLSLAIPANLPSRWLNGFLKGMFSLADCAGVQLAGGDTSTSPPPSGLVADVIVIGAVRRGRAILRSGAQPGDHLYITGTLGGSAAVLHRLIAKNLALTTELIIGEKKANVKRAPNPKPRTTDAKHFFPQPRLHAGQAIARFATSMIDVSDGLSTDLSHLCEESAVATEVDSAALPISPGAQLDEALHGGDDYELLFTAPAKARVPQQIDGVAVTCIGRMVAANLGPPMTLLLSNRRLPLKAHGWEHFRNPAPKSDISKSENPGVENSGN